jgi:hypothetical protein
MVLQNQIGSASNFIGKSVTGLGSDNSMINGVVNSVHIEKGAVNLMLDNGSSLALTNLTDVDTGATAATTSSGTSTSTTTGG